MKHGPLEVVEIVFEGNQFNGEIIAALRELVDTGIIRVLDLAVISKNDVGDVVALEIADLDLSTSESLLEIVSEDEGIFSDEHLGLRWAIISN